MRGVLVAGPVSETLQVVCGRASCRCEAADFDCPEITDTDETSFKKCVATKFAGDHGDPRYIEAFRFAALCALFDVCGDEELDW